MGSLDDVLASADVFVYYVTCHTIACVYRQLYMRVDMHKHHLKLHIGNGPNGLLQSHDFEYIPARTRTRRM